MPNITPNPITVIPAKTSGGSLKNAANLIGYSAAAQGPQAELWANVQKALKDAQSQLDGLANSLRAPLGIPDPIQVVDATGNLVANIGTYVSPLTNASFTGIWAKNFSFATDANPLSNGAIGNGVADDTNALQQTINNSGGVLYLPPNKNFLCSSTLTAPTPTDVVYVYGGGRITSTGNPILAIPHGNWLIEDIIFIANTAGAVIISVVSNGAQHSGIHKCFIANGSGVGVALNGSGVGVAISDSNFTGLGTGVQLTNQTDVMISNCEFNGVTNPVTTSGTCTYNLRGCNTPDHFNPVNRQYAEFAGTTQTITAGAGFTNVTSCSFTISATGTWQISCNAFVQQAAAAANTASIRFSRNGTGDVHTAGGGAGAAQYELHLDLQIALTSGDAIQLQCSAVTANASLLGTGNTGTTNISGYLLGN